MIMQYKKRYPCSEGCTLVSFLSTKRLGRPPTTPRMTAVSFSADDLAALGRLVAVGQAVLQKRPSVVARLNAAMTRMAFHSRKVSWRFGRQGWALVSANNADFDAAAPSHRHLSWLSICDLGECDFPHCPLHRVHYTALPFRGVLA